MKRIIAAILSLSTLYFANVSDSYATQPPESFANIVEPLMPAVVNISTSQKVSQAGRVRIPEFQFPDLPPGSPFEDFRDLFEQFKDQYQGGGGGGVIPERKVYSLGSGFIIDESGFIVTNNHVIAEADEITVKLYDNTELKAKIVGRDKSTDLALLKVDAKRKLPFVTFGDSDNARVGDWIIAIGNPFGLGGSVSAGIISARGRDIYAGPFDDFLQTDAAINSGNSGGPMFNTKGQVIGINTAIFSPSGGNVGIGFAVPSSLAEPVIMQLKNYGHAKRGWIGVKIQTVTPEIADSLGLKKPEGALIVEVTPQSPADDAGIQAGDVILSLGGKEITQMRNLPRAVASMEMGKQTSVKIWRDNSVKELKVTVGELKDSKPEESRQKKTKSQSNDRKSESESQSQISGMELAKITDEMRSMHGIAKNINGVLVMKVIPDSDAFQRGIRAGDIIIRVNEDNVSSPEQVAKSLKDTISKNKQYALVRILRRDEVIFLTLKVG